MHDGFLGGRPGNFCGQPAFAEDNDPIGDGKQLGQLARGHDDRPAFGREAPYTVLYSDLGNALLTVVEDTCGHHDTIYGCCSEPNNFLRYGVRGTHSCFANFTEALAQFGLDRTYIVGNVNFFMSVPVAGDGAAVNVYGHSKAGNYVDLRAERDVLAVLSNCPQMHNPCNASTRRRSARRSWQPKP